MNVLIFALFAFSPMLICAEHFLTFIMPCYNCERWVEEAIESIYSQTNLSCPFEVICTDDGSTDSTYAILKQLSLRHPEITVYRHETNRGGSAARNTCVANGRGDLIFCLDSDNILPPNSVQTLIDWMDATSSDVVAFGGLRYFYTPFKKESEVIYTAPHHQYRLKEITQNTDSPPCSGNYLYTRRSYERTGGYIEGNVFDTFVFGFLQVMKGAKMTYVPGTYYWHRVGVNGYFERESRSKRLEIHFLEFLLSQKELFTEETAGLLEQQLYLVKKGLTACDFICLLQNKKLQLKNPNF